MNQIIVHNLYNPNGRLNDIAILRSASNFIFNNNVRAASIAGPNYNLGDNQVVWAAGWGDTFVSLLMIMTIVLYDGKFELFDIKKYASVSQAGSGIGSEQLRQVELRVINQNTCRNNYAVRGVNIAASMVCSGWPSGGRDHCTFDEGGPLYHNGIVVGVRSFGIGCGQPQFPGVNTRVSSYTSWIQTNS